MLSCKQRQLTIAASNVVGSHKHLRHCAAASDIHERVLHLIPIRCIGTQQPVEHSTCTVLSHSYPTSGVEQLNAAESLTLWALRDSARQSSTQSAGKYFQEINGVRGETGHTHKAVRTSREEGVHLAHPD